ncbi:HAD hydrolase-like protein [Candidatus Woesearchaeota archaeon]|nr:HAD hydrolase-like protein [Candidatus Woesearchaeota archaeon]
MHRIHKNPEQRIEVIGFDLDGTLIYTNRDFQYVAFATTMKEFGIIPTDEKFDQFSFEDRRAWVNVNIPGVSSRQVIDSYWKKMSPEETAANTHVYPDAVECLKYLTSNDKQIALVTANKKENAIVTLTKTGLISYFADKLIIGGRDIIGNVIPKYLGIKKLVESIEVNPASVAYIGDLPIDVEAARNAGVYDTLLFRGDGINTIPKDLNPSLVLSSLEEIVKENIFVDYTL